MSVVVLLLCCRFVSRMGHDAVLGHHAVHSVCSGYGFAYHHSSFTAHLSFVLHITFVTQDHLLYIFIGMLKTHKAGFSILPNMPPYSPSTHYQSTDREYIYLSSHHNTVACLFHSGTELKTGYPLFNPHYRDHSDSDYNVIITTAEAHQKPRAVDHPESKPTAQ